MRATYIAILAIVVSLPVASGCAYAWGGNTPIVDCNDTAQAIHPGATEVPDNGVDDDCNGLADDVDGVPSSSSLDDDSDAISIAQGDCNDHEPSVHVGLAESLGDRIDNDCDGLADEAVDNTPSSDTTDNDGDGYPLSNDRIFGDLFEASS